MSKSPQPIPSSPATTPRRHRYVVTEKRYPIPAAALPLVDATIARLAQAPALQPKPPYLDGTEVVVPLDSPACAFELFHLNLWMRETAELLGMNFEPMASTPRSVTIRVPVDD